MGLNDSILSEDNQLIVIRLPLSKTNKHNDNDNNMAFQLSQGANNADASDAFPYDLGLSKNESFFNDMDDNNDNREVIMNENSIVIMVIICWRR